MRILDSTRTQGYESSHSGGIVQLKLMNLVQITSTTTGTKLRDICPRFCARDDGCNPNNIFRLDARTFGASFAAVKAYALIAGQASGL